MKKKSFKFYLYIGIGMYVLIIIFLNLMDIRTKKKQNDAKMIECPDLKTRSIIIHSILNKKELSDSMFSKGSFYLYFDNGDCFTLFGVNYNWSYETPSLDDFLQVGDSISKKANNDSIFIYRNNNKEYYFVLGKETNKNAKK